MSKFKLEVSTENAELRIGEATEINTHAIVRILRMAVNEILATGKLNGTLRDVNGNTVGLYGHYEE